MSILEEDTRIGFCYCCKRLVPVYREDGHWVFGWHTASRRIREGNSIGWFSRLWLSSLLLWI
jgi:hypothetical protein